MISKVGKIISIVTTAGLAACGGGGDSENPTAPPPPPPTVSVAPSTEPALEAVRALLTKFDASLATAVPPTGAAVTALNDGCYLENGRSKSFIATEFDTDPLAVASQQFRVGSTRTNVRVLADRTANNADGTRRREIDVKYDVSYKDGTKFIATADAEPDVTIISGSSSGAKLPDGSACAAAESKSDWRFYGNRKLVSANVASYNERFDRTALATGLPVTPAVVYSKYIRFSVSDPANVAKYVIISGPGIVTGTPAMPMALKLVSPRLLRDAPEFVGKNGNFVDWKDTDTFRACRNSTGGFASAETADCVTNGANTTNWGSFNATSAATLDANFAALGVVAGGVYTVTVYNDDGWKTVNGQLGKTPIATYTDRLNALPFSATTLAGTGVTTDLFPRVTANSMTPAQVATAVLAKAAFSMNLNWTAAGAMPDGNALGWGSLYSFKQGRVAATQAAFNPASRQFDPTYPAANVTSATLTVPAAVTRLGLPTYMEYGFSINNRNGNVIQSLYTVQ